MTRLDVLIACEMSGTIRDAFIALGHNAMSCDLQASEKPGPHYRGDVRDMRGQVFDLVITHPVCTRLSNSGVRWLSVPPKGRTIESMWAEFEQGIELYEVCRDLVCKARVGGATENPAMNPYAKQRLGITNGCRQVVQPWWFGDPYFKATGLELDRLPRLKATDRLKPPKDWEEPERHAKWSYIHRMSPGPNRQRERSRFFPGMARALALQWSEYAVDVLAKTERLAA